MPSTIVHVWGYDGQNSFSFSSFRFNTHESYISHYTDMKMFVGCVSFRATYTLVITTKASSNTTLSYVAMETTIATGNRVLFVYDHDCPIVRPSETPSSRTDDVVRCLGEAYKLLYTVHTLRIHTPGNNIGITSLV